MATEKQIQWLREFFSDGEIDDEWLMIHIEIEHDDFFKEIKITIDDMNEQEFEWSKG